MAEIFKFFNSAPGDERWHYASDFADYFGSVLSSGLLHENNKYGLQVTVNSGTLTTNVAVGKALIKGYSYENTNDLILTHSLPEQTLDRIDRVVLRLDLRNANRHIRAFVKEGVSATAPVAPELQRDNYVYELSLATVRLRANTSSISVNDIIDTRALEDVCGIAQSLITVPTSVFQQQFDAWFDGIADTTEQSVSDWQTTQEQAFSDWFATIQNTLDGDIAANLANQITTHKKNNSHVYWLGTATGGNSLIATNDEISSYTEGLGVSFKAETTSTSDTTLNINGFGATPILKTNGNKVTNLKANGVYTLRYSGGNFTLQGEGGEYGTATASDVLVGKTLGTENGLVNGTYSNIKSIQKISFSFSSTTDVRTISQIDVSKSIVIITTYPGTSEYATGSYVDVTAKITDSTSVTFNKANSFRTVMVAAIIIEFNGVKSLQKGTATRANGVNISISNIVLEKSLLFFSYRDTTDASDGIGGHAMQGYIANSSALYFWSNNGAKTIEWQVIEFY